MRRRRPSANRRRTRQLHGRCQRLGRLRLPTRNRPRRPPWRRSRHRRPPPPRLLPRVAPPRMRSASDAKSAWRRAAVQRRRRVSRDLQPMPLPRPRPRSARRLTRNPAWNGRRQTRARWRGRRRCDRRGRCCTRHPPRRRNPRGTASESSSGRHAGSTNSANGWSPSPGKVSAKCGCSCIRNTSGRSKCESRCTIHRWACGSVPSMSKRAMPSSSPCHACAKCSPRVA